MKHRIRLSVTQVVEAFDRDSAVHKALAEAKGMDPSAEYLGPVQDQTVEPHNLGVRQKVNNL